MACKNTPRDYKNMTVAEIVAEVAYDGTQQRTYTKGNLKGGAVDCSCAGAFK